ncbi:MAG TPA: hypothetical protein VMW36_06460 [Patescibacteria group bacterium]|nr:hypothetical protein [Patescibacteria group bacterium]
MLTVGELKTLLEEFPDEMKVVSSSVYRENFEDLKGDPIKRFVRCFKEEYLGDWNQYEPLYSTQVKEADEEVVVIW